jgi:hypothetical protein
MNFGFFFPKGDSNSMSMTGVSDDDRIKQSSSPPPPAAHCRLTPTLINDDTKPLDLSIKQNEQPLNLCSKRKRKTPVSLTKRNKTLTSPPPPPPPPVLTNPSMFIPFYAIPPFFDPNQQEMLQQMQTYYLQLQQKLTKNE